MPAHGMLILLPIRLRKRRMRIVVTGIFVGIFFGTLAFGVLASLARGDQEFISIQIQNETMPSPLTDQPGDAERGRRIVLDRERGDCVVCHAMPLPERQFHGTVGLPLDGIGKRYTDGELRLRLVDPKRLNPQTVMPAYYKAEGLFQVREPYRDKPILTAQEIEDVIVYLLTLQKDIPHGAGRLKTKLRLPRNPLQKSNPQLQYMIEDRRSGYTYLSQENRKLQDDEFGNPGMLWVSRGQELWGQYESEALLALSAFVSFQSRGLPLRVQQMQQMQIDGPVKPFFEAGRAFFTRRRGQLDMACAHCHEDSAGLRLRGDVISQGQINGFPIYRHTWQTFGSAHRMFAWCNTAIRAEPLAYGAEDYVNLELYLAWRGRGLPVETPAVRR